MYAIKLELKLNNKERTLMAQHAGYSRVVYNYGLALMTQLDHNQYKGSSAKKISLIKKILTNHTKRQPEFAWMNKLSSRVYQNTLSDLTDAYSRYFKGLAEKPVFKTKKNKQSFTVDSSNGKVVLEAGKFIKIPTLGTFKLHEPLNCRYVTQTFTISKTADRWYVSFTVDAERIPPLFHEVVEPIGIDLGIKYFATLSDGSIYEAPKPYNSAKIKLAKLQYHNRNKQLGNRKKGIQKSNNAGKFYQRLAKKHAELANKRADFLHKTTTEISPKFKNIHIEDLNIRGMIANRKLSVAVSDLGFYEFRRMLEYKSELFSTNLTLVDRWFPSSKMCSCCGWIKSDLKLSDRVFDCSDCGYTNDRDLNASLNLARYKLGWATTDVTPVDMNVPTHMVEAGKKRRLVR